MTEDQVNQLMTLNLDKIAPESVEMIRERLLNVDEGVAQAAFASTKSPNMILIVSIFLGELGIDRFMIGNIGLGVGKFLTWVLSIVTCGIGLIILIPWYIIDLFLVKGATRRYNSNKILQILGQ
jgi:TM2 domain-containing membrane protein YozV